MSDLSSNVEDVKLVVFKHKSNQMKPEDEKIETRHECIDKSKLKSDQMIHQMCLVHYLCKHPPEHELS